MQWYKTAQGLNLPDPSPNFSQKEWGLSAGDYQRFVVDTYDTRLFLTRTAKMVTISLNIWNWHNSSMVFQEFWKYNLKEESKAKTSFEKMIKHCEKVLDDFYHGENQEAPNNLLMSILRNGCWEIDREHLAKTNIPSINYARAYATYENDWRSSLYGNRYPTGETSGF